MPACRSLLSVALSVLAAGAFAAEAGGTPLSSEQAKAVLECPIPLGTARDNLVALGYVVDPLPDAAVALTTRFKTSERDSEKRLLGSFAVERARQYTLTVIGSGIRFQPRVRETEYASGALADRKDRTREYEVPLTAAMLDTLKDMRREVCGAPGPAARTEGRVSPEIEQYIVDRCQAGDNRACGLLRLR